MCCGSPRHLSTLHRRKARRGELFLLLATLRRNGPFLSHRSCGTLLFAHLMHEENSVMRDEQEKAKEAEAPRIPSESAHHLLTARTVTYSCESIEVPRSSGNHLCFKVEYKEEMHQHSPHAVVFETPTTSVSGAIPHQSKMTPILVSSTRSPDQEWDGLQKLPACWWTSSVGYWLPIKTSSCTDGKAF